MGCRAGAITRIEDSKGGRPPGRKKESRYHRQAVSDTLASVLTTEPDWQALSGEVADFIRKLLRRCLTKDRQARLQHIGDARVEIDEALVAPSNELAAAQAGPQTAGWRQALPWVVAIALAVVTGATVRSVMRADVVSVGLIRFSIVPDTGPLNFAGLHQDLAIWARRWSTW